MTIKPSTETYAQLVSDRLAQYPVNCAAAALLYYDKDVQLGVRIEAPSIMKEFVDNVAFGRGTIFKSVKTHLTLLSVDPEGILFFNDRDDFNGPAYYNLFTNTGVADDQRAIVVQFFASTQGKYYAEVCNIIFAIIRSHSSLYTSLLGGCWYTPKCLPIYR